MSGTCNCCVVCSELLHYFGHGLFPLPISLVRASTCVRFLQGLRRVVWPRGLLTHNVIVWCYFCRMGSYSIITCLRAWVTSSKTSIFSKNVAECSRKEKRKLHYMTITNIPLKRSEKVNALDWMQYQWELDLPPWQLCFKYFDMFSVTEVLHIEVLKTKIGMNKSRKVRDGNSLWENGRNERKEGTKKEKGH